MFLQEVALLNLLYIILLFVFTDNILLILHYF